MSSKQCNVCFKTKCILEFHLGRAKCKECYNRIQREKRAKPGSNLPIPGSPVILKLSPVTPPTPVKVTTPSRLHIVDTSVVDELKARHQDDIKRLEQDHIDDIAEKDATIEALMVRIARLEASRTSIKARITSVLRPT